MDVLIVNVLLNLNQTITNFCLLLLHFIQQLDDYLASPTRRNPQRNSRVLSQGRVCVAARKSKKRKRTKEKDPEYDDLLAGEIESDDVDDALAIFHASPTSETKATKYLHTHNEYERQQVNLIRRDNPRVRSEIFRQELFMLGSVSEEGKEIVRKGTLLFVVFVMFWIVVAYKLQVTTSNTLLFSFI